MGCKLHLTADDLQHLSDTFRNRITYDKWHDTYSVHGSNVLSAEQMLELINGFFLDSKDSYTTTDKGDLYEESVIIALENQGLIIMFPGNQRNVETRAGRGGFDAVAYNPSTNEVFVVEAKDWGSDSKPAYLSVDRVTALSSRRYQPNMDQAKGYVDARDDYPSGVKQAFFDALDAGRITNVVVPSPTTLVSQEQEIAMKGGIDVEIVRDISALQNPFVDM
jgi:hypothetical protein